MLQPAAGHVPGPRHCPLVAFAAALVGREQPEVQPAARHAAPPQQRHQRRVLLLEAAQQSAADASCPAAVQQLRGELPGLPAVQVPGGQQPDIAGALKSTSMCAGHLAQQSLAKYLHEIDAAMLRKSQGLQPGNQPIKGQQMTSSLKGWSQNSLLCGICSLMPQPMALPCSTGLVMLSAGGSASPLSSTAGTGCAAVMAGCITMLPLGCLLLLPCAAGLVNFQSCPWVPVPPTTGSPAGSGCAATMSGCMVSCLRPPAAAAARSGAHGWAWLSAGTGLGSA